MVTITYDTIEEFMYVKAFMDAGSLNLTPSIAKELLSLGLEKCNVTYQPSEKYKQEKEKKEMIAYGTVIEREGFTQDNTRVVGCNTIEYNARHSYAVENVHDGTVLTTVKFQKGPIKEVGVNGVHNEDLLLMVIDRLESFQNSEFACKENEEALSYLYGAVAALRSRTNDRKERGVLGTYNV